MSDALLSRQTKTDHLSGAVTEFAEMVQAAVQDANDSGAEVEGTQSVYDLAPADLARLATTGECACGGSSWVEFDLPLNHPAHGRLFRCACRSGDDERRRLVDLFGAGVPPRHRRLTFETFATLPADLQAGKEGALAMARQFADVARYRRQGGLILDGVLRVGLLLFGPVGRGKTGLAAAATQAWADAGRAPLWVAWEDLVTAIQREYSRDGGGSHELIERARRVELLVLDGFGDVKTSADQPAIAYKIISHRHDYFLPTLVTTNLNPLLPDGASEIRERFGAPVHDRLVEDLCHCVPVNGVNLRHEFIDLGGPK